MPESRRGWAKKNGVLLPYYDDPTGVRRWLTAFPSPPDHPLRSSPTWTQAGLPLLSYAEMGDFARVWSVVPILDQEESSACLPHAFAEAMMIARAVSGAPYIPLSPWFLYSLINGGVDLGSNPGDAVTALMQYGIAPASLVTPGTLGPPGINKAATTAATRFKMRKQVRITTMLEAVNAAWFGWAIPFDINADGLNTSPNGVATYTPGGSNHEVLAGEQFRLDPKLGPLLGGRNSWGTAFGVNGRCWWTTRHIENSMETHAIQSAYDDPQDADMPPPFS